MSPDQSNKKAQMKAAKAASGLSCRQVAKQLQEFLDAEVDSDERRAQLEQHLDLCRACGLEAETYRSIKSVLHNKALPPDSPALDRLRSFGQSLIDSD